MFWNMCCCGRSQKDSSLEMSSGNNESQNTQISVINTNEEENGQRMRTDTQSSGNSMHSIKSFYSAKSTSSRDEADYYSVCSVESYKST
ncbi:hypothetical protein Zmor_020361 [Zophobas morio]|uniref:Uncharacterized protein n=1 Tax=Zophobas morio TaxID=2755281 RepID=A0AA38I6L7_9CUCU|nr:hypothetical protein Zmor_020361 [Zophobas morio]